MIFVVIIIAFLSYFICKRLYHNVLNPVMLFVGINLISIFLSIIQDSSFQYSTSLNIQVFVMFISFLIGIIIGSKKLFRRERINQKIEDKRKFFKIIIVAGILYDIALLGYLRNLFTDYSFIDFFLKMNEVNASVQSDDETFWYSYVIPLGMPLFIMCWYYLKTYGKNYFLIIQSVLSVLYCLSPRRDSLFNLILVSLFFTLSIYQDKHQQISQSTRGILRHALVIVALIIVVMSVTQSLLNKDSKSNVSISDVELPAFLNSPYLYISLNYPYLQITNPEYKIIPDYPLQASGRMGYLILNKLTRSEFGNREDFELDFYQIGNFITNTAPILYYMVLDFGVFFFIGFIILGIISQRLYYLSNSRDIIGRMVGAMWYALLVLSFRGYLLIYLSFCLNIVYTLIIGFFMHNRILFSHREKRLSKQLND